MIVYADGNIDHPLILGAVYNQLHLPPWELSGQAALAGLRSQELGGNRRGNHLILDDTQEKIQAQLKSDHQCSQLSLVQITRIEDRAGRKRTHRVRVGSCEPMHTASHGLPRDASYYGSTANGGRPDQGHGRNFEPAYFGERPASAIG